MRLALIQCVAFQIVFLLLAANSYAATRRALIVGINTYEAPTVSSEGSSSSSAATGAADRKWRNLSGSVNDATAMASILVARFGFKAEDVRVLIDSEAGREAILTAFREHLIDPVSAGDVCVFFFAGHGSQMLNSGSIEGDGKDETLVPADSYRGVQDIRDKEWSHLYNDVLDKGAQLTVFLDSCHSTSAQRGVPVLRTTRFLNPDLHDVAQDSSAIQSDPRGKPEDRGALILSAAQEFQAAHEIRDGQGQVHGAFSMALMKKLRSCPIEEPANRIFLSVKGQIQGLGLYQQPNIAGPAERRAAPLFGANLDGTSTRPIVSLKSIDRQGNCQLLGGLAVGLQPGCELKRVTRGAEEPVRLRVTSVQGMVRSKAELISGDPAVVNSGDIFELDRWVGADELFLRAWIPPTFPDRVELMNVASMVLQVCEEENVDWVVDPTEVTPTEIMQWSETGWRMTCTKTSETRPIVAHPDSISLALQSCPHYGGTGLFFFAPPTIALGKGLSLGGSNSSSAIGLAGNEGEAHYILSGRWNKGFLEYAWVQPGLTREDGLRYSSMPSRTAWYKDRVDEGGQGTARDLNRTITALARIRGWLQLEGPATTEFFPYRLVVKIGGRELEEQQTGHDGEKVEFLLRANRSELSQGVIARYVYLFTINSNGESALLFPGGSEGNTGNRLPSLLDDSGVPSEEIRLPLEFEVDEPFGIDTCVLLTTQQPLSDTSVLENSGVRSPIRNTSLGRLLQQRATLTRGTTPPMTMDWSIQRVSIRSAP